jgi:hypothetical protein
MCSPSAGGSVTSQPGVPDGSPVLDPVPSVVVVVPGPVVAVVVVVDVPVVVVPADVVLDVADVSVVLVLPVSVSPSVADASESSAPHPSTSENTARTPHTRMLQR